MQTGIRCCIIFVGFLLRSPVEEIRQLSIPAKLEQPHILSQTQANPIVIGVNEGQLSKVQYGSGGATELSMIPLGLPFEGWSVASLDSVVQLDAYVCLVVGLRESKSDKTQKVMIVVSNESLHVKSVTIMDSFLAKPSATLLGASRTDGGVDVCCVDDSKSLTTFGTARPVQARLYRCNIDPISFGVVITERAVSCQPRLFPSRYGLCEFQVENGEIVARELFNSNVLLRMRVDNELIGVSWCVAAVEDGRMAFQTLDSKRTGRIYFYNSESKEEPRLILTRSENDFRHVSCAIERGSSGRVLLGYFSADSTEIEEVSFPTLHRRTLFNKTLPLDREFNSLQVSYTPAPTVLLVERPISRNR